MDFRILGLSDELARAVESLGFEKPTPIQEKAIPYLIEGERDFVGLAQTGTGKTGAYGLPLIQSIDLSISRPQAIVICPTRELCLQIAGDLRDFAKYMEDIRVAAVYGGADIVKQIRTVKGGAQIIAATPGRLLDLINRKAIKPGHVTRVVLDEADEMLNMGFQEDINAILSSLPDERRTWLFSATMPKGVAAIAAKYQTNPVEVTMGGRNQASPDISHICYMIHAKNRYAALKRILDYCPDMFGLVFCRTRKDTQEIAEALMADGYNADALHGDLSQPQRDQVMGRFRRKAVQVLAATDVAARGLDVDDISHVIHYVLPDDPEAYTHRSGRTARAGKQGKSIALITPRENYRLKDLERRGKFSFQLDSLPQGRDICQKQVAGLAEKLASVSVRENDIAEYMPDILDAFEGLSREEIIQKAVSTEFNRLLDYYRNAGDINAKPREKVKGQAGAKFTREKIVGKGRHGKGPKKDRLKGRKTQRFFINRGRLDKVNEGAIVRLVCENSGIKSRSIGQIDLNREFSFFEVEKSLAPRVLRGLENATLDGKALQVRAADKQKPAEKGRKKAA
ncbi:DEAD/DEAH box helicase [Desulfatibacillum aliphaticivorans]|uniref:DEAD/DEAH box helicase n=1 Tax=Desulfatibacillum aliphaticivorans TaxID=218208 RepID=UPI000406751B|nr:DEAD/DEAH box helicase [Desulfatibacillum aliphaticivorans]